MKHVAAILLVLLFLPLSTVLADEVIRGKYEVIGDIDKLKGVKTIKMLEFFNYSCGHCYKFLETCLLYTSPSPRDISGSRMPSSA